MADQKSGGGDRKQGMGQGNQERDTMRRSDRQQQAQRGQQSDTQKGGQNPQGGQDKKDR